MAIPIQFRRGTAAEWAAADPVLFEGEIGLLISDSPEEQLMKMGDGTLKWSELPWALRGPQGFNFQYIWDGTWVYSYPGLVKGSLISSISGMAPNWV